MSDGGRGRSPNPRQIASERFLEPLADVVGRGVPTLLLYGDQDDLWEELQRAEEGQLGNILQHSASSVDVLVIPGEVHGFARVEAQEAVADGIVRWLSKLAERTTRGIPQG